LFHALSTSATRLPVSFFLDRQQCIKTALEKTSETLGIAITIRAYHGAIAKRRAQKWVLG